MNSRVAVFLLGTMVGLASKGESILRKSPELAFSVPGEGQKLLSQYRGKVVALEFILTTCPHCQAASKVMNEMQERYGGEEFQALNVAIDPNADLLVENFKKDHQVGFTVGWVSLEQMMSYMGFTERPVVPQIVLIDARGNVRYQTPRLGDAESMKPEVINGRIAELIGKGDSEAVRGNKHMGKRTVH